MGEKSKPAASADSVLSGLSAADLMAYGLQVHDGRLLNGLTRFENPSCVYGHRLKSCSFGAFVYFNAAGSTSAYRVQFGRYSQIGESSVIGPPEHPQTWFSSHPFAFTRPEHMPNYYQMPEFARLAPEQQPGPSFADTVSNETWIGHEAYVGVGCFVKRGVRIGDGATVGANSVVTRDIPAYAVAVGSPARVLRLRFADHIVERLLALQWWRYDLAPFKQQVDYSKVEATLDFFEERKADGRLQTLRPDSYSVERKHDGFELIRLAEPLYFA